MDPSRSWWLPEDYHDPVVTPCCRAQHAVNLGSALGRLSFLSYGKLKTLHGTPEKF